MNSKSPTRFYRVCDESVCDESVYLVVDSITRHTFIIGGEATLHRGYIILDKKGINHENTRNNTKKYHEIPAPGSCVFVYFRGSGLCRQA